MKRSQGLDAEPSGYLLSSPWPRYKCFGVYRTGLMGFWTGYQALKGAATGELLTQAPGLVLKTRHLVSLRPRLRGQRPKQDVKRTGGFAEAAEKLSQLIPSFPPRLIKEEIALQVAAMTKRLLEAALIFQRGLFKEAFIAGASAPTPPIICRHQPWQKSCGGFGSECVRGDMANAN